MQFLSFSASTHRHIDWADAILAVMAAHQTTNYLLTPEQKALLAEEEKLLSPFVDRLRQEEERRKTLHSATLRQVRAERRVADYICDTTVVEADSRLRPFREDIGHFLPGGFARLYQGVSLSRLLRAGAERTASILISAADVLGGLPADRFPFAGELSSRIGRAASQLSAVNDRYEQAIQERASLAVRQHRGEVDLREALQQMNGRLRSRFTQSFIESLYPQLRNGSRVIVDDAADEVDDADNEQIPTATEAA